MRKGTDDVHACRWIHEDYKYPRAAGGLRARRNLQKLFLDIDPDCQVTTDYFGRYSKPYHTVLHLPCPVVQDDQ